MKRSTGLTLGSTVSRHPDQISSDITGETILMSLENGRYYGFRAVAQRIWDLLEEPTAVEVICAALRAEYNVDPGQCEHEVLAFVNDLIRENVAVIVCADD
jgi:hypothetical protein